MGIITIRRPVGRGVITPPPEPGEYDETISEATHWLVNSVEEVVGEPVVVDETVAESVEVAESVSESLVDDAIFLFDDFSQYDSTAELRNVSLEKNPWDLMNQHEAFVPGEFVFLDESPPSGSTTGKTMRYDHGQISDCGDNVQDTGGGARKSLPDNTTEVWAEFRVYPENWTSTACGFFAYKLFFLDTLPFGRYDLNWVSEINGGLQGGGPGAQGFTLASTEKETFGDWINTWTRVRFHIRLASVPGSTSDGIVEVWIDDERVWYEDSEPLTATEMYQVRLGANLNNMTFNDMRTHWDDVKVYLTDPGW